MGLFDNPFGDEPYQPGDPPRPEDQPAGVVISPDTRRADRVPPGQSRTRRWPVLDASGPPRIDLANWKLEVFGLVEHPGAMNRVEYQQLPRVRVFSDFHQPSSSSRLRPSL